MQKEPIAPRYSPELLTLPRSIASKFPEGDLDSPEDVVRIAQTIYRGELFLPGVVLQKRRSLRLKNCNPIRKDLRIVVGSPPREHPTHQLVPGNGQFQDTIDIHRPPLEEVIERGRLGECPRKTIQQKAGPTIGQLQALGDHTEDKRVGHELPQLHKAIGLEPLGAASSDLRSQHFTGREVRNPQQVNQSLTLRSLTSPGRSDEDDPHD